MQLIASTSVVGVVVAVSRNYISLQNCPVEELTNPQPTIPADGMTICCVGTCTLRLRDTICYSYMIAASGLRHTQEWLSLRKP